MTSAIALVLSVASLASVAPASRQSSIFVANLAPLSDQTLSGLSTARDLHVRPTIGGIRVRQPSLTWARQTLRPGSGPQIDLRLVRSSGASWRPARVPRSPGCPKPQRGMVGAVVGAIGAGLFAANLDPPLRVGRDGTVAWAAVGAGIGALVGAASCR